MTRSTPLQMVQRICVRLDALWRSRLLREESAFAARAAAIDEIELDISARLTAARTVGAPAQQVVALERYAARLTSRLQARNCCDLQRLRQRIRLGRSRGARLRRELLDLAGRAPAPDAAGYDTLDAVVSGLLLVEDMPPGGVLSRAGDGILSAVVCPRRSRDDRASLHRRG